MSFAVDIVAMVFAMPRALFPEMADDRFGGPSGAGWLYAAISIGAVVGGLASGWIGRVNRQGLALVLAVAAWGASVAVAGLAQALWLVVLLLAVAGAADLVSAVYRQTILQTYAPDEMRGRLQGVFIVVVAGGPRLGDVRAGASAARLGPDRRLGRRRHRLRGRRRGARDGAAGAHPLPASGRRRRGSSRRGRECRGRPGSQPPSVAARVLHERAAGRAAAPESPAGRWPPGLRRAGPDSCTPPTSAGSCASRTRPSTGRCCWCATPRTSGGGRRVARRAGDPAAGRRPRAQPRERSRGVPGGPGGGSRRRRRGLRRRCAAGRLACECWPPAAGTPTPTRWVGPAPGPDRRRDRIARRRRAGVRRRSDVADRVAVQRAAFESVHLHGRALGADGGLAGVRRVTRPARPRRRPVRRWRRARHGRRGQAAAACSSRSAPPPTIGAAVTPPAAARPLRGARGCRCEQRGGRHAGVQHRRPSGPTPGPGSSRWA